MSGHGKRVSRIGDRSIPSKSPAVTGSRHVLVNGKPVLRVGDQGIAGWRAVDGAPFVLVNDRRLHRIYDPHSSSECGQASTSVAAGDICERGEVKKLAAETGLRIFCKHKFDGRQRAAILAESTFEVVQPYEADKSEDVVTILYKDSASPPPDVIQVRKTIGEKVETFILKKDGNEGDGYSRYILSTEYVPPSGIVNWLTRNFVDYELLDLRRRVLVRQHDPQKWQIEFTAPKLRTMKIGHKTTGPIFGNKDYKLSEKKETITHNDSGWREWSETNPVDRVALIVDGKRYEAKGLHQREQAKNPLEETIIKIWLALDGYLSIFDTIKSIFRFIKNKLHDLPKWGWYFDIDIQLFTGSLRVAWQWKEHTDHRAFQWFGVFMKMTLIQVNLEIGVGLSISKFEAQAYIKFSGKLDIETNLERVSPDYSGPLAHQIKFSIEGGLGVRVKVGTYVEVKLEGTTALEFMLAFTLGGETPFALRILPRWTGLKATLSANAEVFGVGGGYTREWTTSGIDLPELRWPAHQEYNPPITTRATIEQIIMEQLTNWCNTNVRIPAEHFYQRDTYLPINDIARQITDVIMKRQEIRRDYETMEGLGHWIGGELSELEELRWLRVCYAIEIGKFNAFLTQLDNELANHYVDPCAEALKNA